MNSENNKIEQNKKDEDLREFTKEEAEEYQKSLEKIYQPTNVNIFDICK